jgi:outer membrane protein OmpA-like peptidoglycan-associated protein
MNSYHIFRCIFHRILAALTPVLILCSLLLQMVNTSATAQVLDSSARTRWGVYGQYALNRHLLSFKDLPGVPTCCPQPFSDALSNGFAAGLLYDIPFGSGGVGKVLGVSLRASYTAYPLQLSQDENLPLGIFGGVLNERPSQHRIASPLGNVGIEPMLTIKPFSGLNKTDDGFTILLGARAAYVLQRSITYGEYAPDETVFLNPTTGKFDLRVRNEFAGDIPQANTLAFSVMGGIAWEIPLNAKRTVYITPEIFYSFPITPVVANGSWTGSWSVHQIRAGLALKFAPERRVIDTTTTPPALTDEPPVTQPPSGTKQTDDREKTPPQRIPPPKSEPKELTSTITAVGVERDGKELANVTFRVEEFLSTNLRPLLPYIFFETGSDNLPDRYERLANKDTTGFRVDNLHNYEMLETYHQILNIVGKRMRAHPAAKLTITGCNDNVNTTERGNAQLSYRRAKAVRDYLTNIWGLDTARMPIQTRNLPASPTVSNTRLYESEVQQENRRVEFAADTWEILEPIKTADTVRTVSPPIIRFRPRTTLPAGTTIAGWTLTAGQNGQTLKEFAGTGAIPPILDWNITENQATVPRAPVPLDYTLTVIDNNGNRLESRGAAPVEQLTIQRKRRERIKDREIDRYSLILFDFDKSDLTPQHRRVASFIKGQITPDATVRISGYTDYTNPLDYSLRLSKARARETASTLELINKAEVRGLGKTVLLYDTDLPEGRFYCRTVTIIAETPVRE